MTDYRTPLETEIHLLVLDVVQALIEPKIGRVAFMNLLGRLRTLRVHLDNKKFGCPSGRHAGECTCLPNVVGKSVAAIKRKKSKETLK